MLDAGMGTGEGSQAFGWWAYSGQAKAISEFYRKIGIPNFGRGTTHIHTKDGITYSTKDDSKGWDNSPGYVKNNILQACFHFSVAFPR